jgi:hypothetical protein
MSRKMLSWRFLAEVRNLSARTRGKGLLLAVCGNYIRLN